MGLNFYKHHLGDYDGATAHLSWEEDLAYRRLLSIYYRRESAIPKEPGDTYRLVRATTRVQKEAVSRVLSEFFIEQEDGWHQKRADEEITAYKHQAETNRRIARSRYGHDSYNDSQHDSYNDSSTKRVPNHKPLTKNHKPDKEKKVAFAPPAWVPEDPWKAWLEVRDKKKIPNTDRSLQLAVKELDRLRGEGNDPVAVLEMATLKGWRGLFPVKATAPASDWVKEVI